MAARKNPHNHYGLRPCEMCRTEGGYWRNLWFYICERCDGRGWRRI